MANVNDKKALTLAAIERLQVGEKTPIDAMTPGLYVEANRDGTRSYRYLRKCAGKVVKRTLGTSRDFSLVEARTWAAGMNRTIAEGANPVEVEAAKARDDAAEADRIANTFRKVWGRYIEAIEPKQAPHTIRMKVCRMNKDVLPRIGDKPITDVTLDDLWAIALAKKEAGYETASNHIVADLKSFFSWCQSHGRHVANLDGRNPATNLKKLGDDKERTRFLDFWELPLLLRAMAELETTDRRILTLLLLTGQRLDNVLTAQYDQWEPELPAWVIMKMKGKKDERVPNVLPLAPWGRSLFVRPEVEQPWRARARQHVTEAAEKRTAQYLFPAARGEGPRQGHMRTLLDDVRERMQSHAPANRTVDHIIPHDFRRTLKSHLAKLKISKEHRHAIAGHRESGIDKHYMMYEFFDEKAFGLAVWENELIRIARREGVAEALCIPANPIALSLVA